MKTNEAPEKIFLEWYRIGDKKYRDWCITPETNNEPVEYTRTDAFIKKAVEWFRRIDYDDRMPPFETTEEFIEGFKNAMKGE